MPSLIYSSIVVVWPVFALTGIYLAIAMSISDAVAPKEEWVTEHNPALGFWLRGNHSFFQESTMNRTDVNASSDTYMHWIPPPGVCSAHPRSAIFFS